jgi:hypothetical protein
MPELMINSLRLKEFPTLVNTLETNIQYLQLNQILGPVRTICYHLFGGKLFFVGDIEITSDILRGHGFSVSNIKSVNLDLIKHWETLRVVFYKALRFFFESKNFVWKPKRRNQVFIVEPKKYNDMTLVHELVNNNNEKLIVYEGFRYFLEFIDEEPVLSVIPKVKPIFPLVEASGMLPSFTPMKTFIDANPATIRRKGFYTDFRPIALKPNWKKRELLKTFSELISERSDEIVIPVGNLLRGLVVDPEFLVTEEVEADFYGT